MAELFRKIREVEPRGDYTDLVNSLQDARIVRLLTYRVKNANKLAKPILRGEFREADFNPWSFAFGRWVCSRAFAGAADLPRLSPGAA